MVMSFPSSSSSSSGDGGGSGGGRGNSHSGRGGRGPGRPFSAPMEIFLEINLKNIFVIFCSPFVMLILAKFFGQ